LVPLGSGTITGLLPVTGRITGAPAGACATCACGDPASRCGAKASQPTSDTAATLAAADSTSHLRGSACSLAGASRAGSTLSRAATRAAKPSDSRQPSRIASLIR